MSTSNDDDNIEIIGAIDPRLMSGRTESEDDDRSLTDLVEQPAKVMRVGSMIRQLLEEVRAAPLDVQCLPINTFSMPHWHRVNTSLVSPHCDCHRSDAGALGAIAVGIVKYTP